MADRSVTVKLGADTSQYESAMGKAAASTDNVSKAALSAKDQIQKAFGDTGDNIKNAFSSAGKATAAVFTAGVAAAATLSAAVLATGLSYNTLQQKSRAALTTLLDGATAANAQMDKLDAFARTSPFAKSTFITAQQQLLGFGVAADKVLPVLSAINDAVAAVGGSSQQVGELAFVFAQISAAGKITATDLMQFGQRGVNAAELIGSQMGKTGAEIRESITKGTLGADEALDALTKGMAAKFGGAAANVKQTMDGALDRIKAAWRDIGSVLAEPFISKNGGGAAVDWANGIADVMRQLQAKIGGMWREIMIQAGPALDDIPKMFARISDAIAGMNTGNIDHLIGTMKDIAPVVAAVGAAVTVKLGGAIPVLGGMFSAINPLVAAFAALALTSPSVRDGLSDLAAPAKELMLAFAQIASSAAQDLLPMLSGMIQVLTPIVGAVADAAKWFGQLPGPIKDVAVALAALLIFKDTLGPFFSGLAKTATTAFASIAANGGGALGTIKSIGSGAATAGKNLMAAFGGPVGLAIVGVTAALGFLFSAIGNSSKAAQEQKKYIDDVSDSLDKNTGAITDNTRETIKNSFTPDQLSAMTQYGINIETVTDAILGNAAASTLAAQQINDAATAATAASPAYQAISGSLSAAGISAQDFATALLSTDPGALNQLWATYSATLNTTGNAQDNANDKLAQWQRLIGDAGNAAAPVVGILQSLASQTAGVASATGTASANIDKWNQSARDLSQDTDKANRSMGDLGGAAGAAGGALDTAAGAAGNAAEKTESASDALKTLSDAAKEAQDQATLLQAALDGLAGKNVTAEAAARANDAAIRAVAASLRDQDAATQSVAQKTDDLGAAMDKKVTKDYTAEQKARDVATAQRALSDAMDGTKDAQDKVATAMDKAAETADQQVSAVIRAKLATGDYTGAMQAGTAEMALQREAFIKSATAAGVTRDAAEALATKLGLIPKNVEIAVRAEMSQAEIQIANLKTHLANIPRNIIVHIDQQQTGAMKLADARSGGYTGGYMSKAGRWANARGYASGGLLGGRPPDDPRTDNLLAVGPSGPIAVRSGEFIQSQPAVDHYGVSAMDALNSRRVPRGNLAGYATGGPVGSVDDAEAALTVSLTKSTKDINAAKAAADAAVKRQQDLNAAQLKAAQSALLAAKSADQVYNAEKKLTQVRDVGNAALQAEMRAGNDAVNVAKDRANADVKSAMASVLAAREAAKAAAALEAQAAATMTAGDAAAAVAAAAQAASDAAAAAAQKARADAYADLMAQQGVRDDQLLAANTLMVASQKTTKEQKILAYSMLNTADGMSKAAKAAGQLTKAVAALFSVAAKSPGGVAGHFASGGLVGGRAPSDPRLDNLLASSPYGQIAIRSGEYISNQRAVNFYGAGLYKAMDRLSVPRQVMNPLPPAAPAYHFRPQQMPGGPGGGTEILDELRAIRAESSALRAEFHRLPQRQATLARTGAL